MSFSHSERSFLIFDIETIVDSSLPLTIKPDLPSQPLPPPPYHQVVAIGVLWMDSSYRVKRFGIVGEGKSEAQSLQDFVRFVEDRTPDLVTYNGRGFDLPVIVSRCLRHAIPFRHYFQSKDLRYRYSTSGHFDLMDFMSDFGASRACSLDVVAKLIGLPGKVGVDGKDVGPLIEAGKIAEVYAYCLCDVMQTTALFLRVQLLRGELDLETYRSAMQALLEKMNADERVRLVHDAVEPQRLLATE